jgi:hypothetical protein
LAKIDNVKSSPERQVKARLLSALFGLHDKRVLSNDIMKVSEPEILKTRCEMKVIGREIVFQQSL